MRRPAAAAAAALLAAAILALLAGQVAALSLQQVKSMGKMPRQMCLQRTGASKDLVDKMQTGDFADDPKLKCYCKCCMGMMQVFKNDVYNTASAIAQADKLLPDSHKERVKAVVMKCEHAADGITDGCEAAFVLTKCSYETDPEVFLFP